MAAWSTPRCQSDADPLTSSAAAPSPTRTTSATTPSRASSLSAASPKPSKFRSMLKRSANALGCRCRAFPSAVRLLWEMILRHISRPRILQSSRRHFGLFLNGGGQHSSIAENTERHRRMSDSSPSITFNSII